MVLFSLNGFSNKKCAIIELLKYHIDQTVSLVPTDTAIKGDIYLSEETIILIDEEFF